MISFIDDQVGRFLTALKHFGNYENTILVFLSDHGEYPGEHGMLRKNPALYDSLVRIPFFMTWEAGLTGGRTITDTMVE